MTQFIKPQNGGGQGGGQGDMQKSVYDPNNVEANAFDYDNFINTPDLSGYQTTANLVTDLDDADNTHYPSSLAVKDAITSAGGGDVTGPNSSTDGDIALFDGDTGKIIKDGSKSLSDLVQTSGNQTINGTKTYTTSPVVPSKTTDVTNTGTAIATEAQVYKKQDKLTTQTAYTTQGTASKVPQITTNTLGQVTGITEVSINYPSQVDNTAYGDSWDGVTTTAPSKNAVYDKIDSIDELIPSAATSSNKLADTNYVNDSINSITAYYITKNAAGDQFATYAELAAATTFYSGGVQRTPTRNDYCIVLDDENHDHGTTRYIYQNNQWEYQYTVNETALTQAQLDALNSGITSGKVSTYDGYATTISGKQDALTSQTAYTTKGTSTKVATISTNTLGQVTAITETSIAFPVTSVNGGTGAVTVNEFNPGGTATTGYVLKKTADGYGWDAESGAVTSVNGQTGAVTVQETLVNQSNIKSINGNSLLGSGDLTVSGLPTGGTEGQILMIVSGTPTWVTPTAKGFKMLSPNSPLTVPYDWYGTNDQYTSATKSNDTEYRTV